MFRVDWLALSPWRRGASDTEDWTLQTSFRLAALFRWFGRQGDRCTALSARNRIHERCDVPIFPDVSVTTLRWALETQKTQLYVSDLESACEFDGRDDRVVVP